LLLENEEEDTGLSQTKIYINIPTSDATNQELEISVAGGAPITESIPSETLVNFELSQQYWADNGDVEITPKNDDITGDTITIHFPGTFTVSAALNYLYDDEFEIVAQNEDFAESGSGSESGSGGGSSFDFVETIRNIGFRLLDEPTNVNAYFDEAAGEVQIKWTDPADITTLEPVPCEWAGTVVVRKEGSAPRHRWDGTLITDSTTRDQYASTALVDNSVEEGKGYYYGIFPYHVWLDDANNPIKHYRYTKVVGVEIKEEYKSWLLNSYYVSNTISTFNSVIDNPGGIPTVVAPTGSEFVINNSNILTTNSIFTMGTMWYVATTPLKRGQANKLFIELETNSINNYEHDLLFGFSKIIPTYIEGGYSSKCWQPLSVFVSGGDSADTPKTIYEVDVPNISQDDIFYLVLLAKNINMQVHQIYSDGDFVIAN